MELEDSAVVPGLVVQGQIPTDRSVHLVQALQRLSYRDCVACRCCHIDQGTCSHTGRTAVAVLEPRLASLDQVAAIREMVVPFPCSMPAERWKRVSNLHYLGHPLHCPSLTLSSGLQYEKRMCYPMSKTMSGEGAVIVGIADIVVDIDSVVAAVTGRLSLRIQSTTICMKPYDRPEDGWGDRKRR